MEDLDARGALIRNFGDILAVIFSHHRDTEDTETLLLFAHREMTMGKNSLSEDAKTAAL